MDNRVWYLAVGTLAAAFVALLVDAALPSFDVSPGFWAVLSAVLGFLGASSVVRVGRNNKNGER